MVSIYRLDEWKLRVHVGFLRWHQQTVFGSSQSGFTLFNAAFFFYFVPQNDFLVFVAFASILSKFQHVCCYIDLFGIFYKFSSIKRSHLIITDKKNIWLSFIMWTLRIFINKVHCSVIVVYVILADSQKRIQPFIIWDQKTTMKFRMKVAWSISVD